MRKIAELAGVHRSTVSLALKNDPRLKPATCKKIQRLAAQLGYRKNPTVSQLMSLLREGQKRHFQGTIAILTFGIRTVSSEVLLAGALKRATALGYGVEEFNAKDVPPARLEKILTSRGIRAILISSHTGNNVLPKEYEPIWKKFSCCVVGLRPENPPLHFVANDNYMTMLTAMRRLYGLGFRTIGLALHQLIDEETEYRFVGGYLAAIRRCCPDVISPPIIIFEPGKCKDAFLAWYREHRPDVVICIHRDPLDWLKEAGYRVPEEVSLVNLDASFGNGWAGMRQDWCTLGEMAVDEVVSQINSNYTGAISYQKATLNESCWEFGDTLKIPGT